jgi:hypothetical protein
VAATSRLGSLQSSKLIGKACALPIRSLFVAEWGMWCGGGAIDRSNKLALGIY